MGNADGGVKKWSVGTANKMPIRDDGGLGEGKGRPRPGFGGDPAGRPSGPVVELR